MSNLWRIHKNTDVEGRDIGQYCLDNNLLAVGWSLNDKHIQDQISDTSIDIRGKRAQIKTKEDYIHFVQKYNIYKGKFNPNLKRFMYEVQPNDLVWMREKGEYYLGRITESSHWLYNPDPNVLEIDASNQICDIEWLKIGDESCVPGAVAASMIRGQTIRRIKKEGMLEYSQLLYNKKTKRKRYEVSLTYSTQTFYT